MGHRFANGLSFLALGLFFCGRCVAAEKGEDVEFFEKKIRPILVEHCYKCHGADEKKIKGGLRLDSKEGLLKGGDTRPAIVPGDPEKSLLIEAVRYTNEELQMPPKQKLGDQQIADLVEWVKRGAPDPRGDDAPATTGADAAEGRNWWAFQPVKEPAPPVVKDPAWAAGAIDRFILAKIEQKGLRPAAPADKRTLIRRATLDLIGLPPTVEEVNAFLADESPDAFEKVVDRLLASPQYGERWARHWLDVVRYTDSFDARGLGGAGDSSEAWRYRDWVVGALNRDLPYDEFVRRQVAGDIIATRPGATFDPGHIIATGVFAIGNWGGGDADKEKLITDMVDDQIDVVGRAFLGVTLACARCHDHKFDPITTADYYGLAGIFFSSHIVPNPGPKTGGPEMLRIPLVSKQELEQRERDKVRIAELQKQREAVIDGEMKRLAAEMLPQLERYVRAARDTGHSAADLNPHLLARWKSILSNTHLKLLSTRLADIHGTPGVHAWANDAAGTPSATVNTRADAARFITITLPPKSVALHPSPRAGVAAAFRSPVAGKVTVGGRVADADANCGDGIEWRIQHNGLVVGSGAIANGASATIPDVELTLAAGDWIHLAILPKGGYECDTTTVELTISQGAQRWSLTESLTAEPLHPNPHGPWHLVDLAGDAPPPPLITKLATATVDQLPAIARDAAGDPAARDFLGAPAGTFLGPLRSNDILLAPPKRDEVQRLSNEVTELKTRVERPIPLAHGLQEGGCPQSPHEGLHDVKVHIRGRYDRLGQLIPRRFPAVIAGRNPPVIREGSGRLELAQWLTDGNNPLTARVMVNRIWQHHFGQGLVRTPNNFGKLGEPPTHPELLDHLATQFVRSGWSIKSMHRAIMTSAAYRQSSLVSEQAFKADPDNRLFSRMNRRRLDAEQIRDSLLTATGELDRTMGGPAVKDLSTPRRTLYVMTIRSDRSNYRMLFDAADPTAMIDKRIDSTVAPQALFLLNNPFMLARTKALAARVAKLEAPDDSARIDWLYHALFSRPPADEERSIGMRLMNALNIDRQLLWERYCQVLLCTNEFVYVD